MVILDVISYILSENTLWGHYRFSKERYFAKIFPSTSMESTIIVLELFSSKIITSYVRNKTPSPLGKIGPKVGLSETMS